MSSRRIRHEPHTCSELSYRIVLWNASVVQKHSINSWSKWKNNGDWELTLPLQVSNRCRIHSWNNNHRHSQENFTTLLSCLTRLRQTCKTQNNIVMPVLGLAGRHFQQVKKLRQIAVEIAGTWLQHPRVISVMNAALFLLGNQLQTWDCPPCNLKFVQLQVLHLLLRSFTHTHTKISISQPLPMGFWWFGLWRPQVSEVLLVVVLVLALDVVLVVVLDAVLMVLGPSVSSPINFERVLSRTTNMSSYLTRYTRFDRAWST